MTEYILPILLLIVLIYTFFKRQKVYDVFVKGSSEAINLVISLVPYLLAILLISELFETSGLSQIFINFIYPFFKILGVPKELIKLIIIKPFSGSGSLALLSEILKTYGTENYLSLCACCLYGSSETIFYVSSVYYVKCAKKEATKGIIISLIATLISTVFCVFICNFFI